MAITDVTTNFAKAIINPIAELVGKFVKDKDLAAQLAHDIATLAEKHAHTEIIAQMEVNKVEAAHKSLFVAGWRPWIGWVCGIAFAMNFVVIPIFNFVAAVYGITEPATGMVIIVPPLDMAMMMPVLMGMLGLGVYRTYEKTKGVAREK